MGDHGVSLDSVEKVEKHKTDDLKRCIYDSKHYIYDSKHYIYDSKHYIYDSKQFLSTLGLAYVYTCLESMILGQLKIGERQALCGGLVLLQPQI